MTQPTENEYKLARALVAATLPDHVAPTVLGAIDSWHAVVQAARGALEQQQRAEGDLTRFYTVKELMILMRKSDSAVRVLLDNGTLPFTRIGGSICVPIDAVERYLAEQTTQNKPPAPRAPRARRTVTDTNTIRKYDWLVD